MVSYRNPADAAVRLTYVSQGVEHQVIVPPGGQIALPEEHLITSPQSEALVVVDPDEKTSPQITLPDGYYILGDGTLYTRHLFRRNGSHVKLVALIIDADAAERIIHALNGADNG